MGSCCGHSVTLNLPTGRHFDMLGGCKYSAHDVNNLLPMLPTFRSRGCQFGNQFLVRWIFFNVEVSLRRSLKMQSLVLCPKLQCSGQPRRRESSLRIHARLRQMQGRTELLRLLVTPSLRPTLLSTGTSCSRVYPRWSTSGPSGAVHASGSLLPRWMPLLVTWRARFEWSSVNVDSSPQVARAATVSRASQPWSYSKARKWVAWSEAPCRSSNSSSSSAATPELGDG